MSRFGGRNVVVAVVAFAGVVASGCPADENPPASSSTGDTESGGSVGTLGSASEASSGGTATSTTTTASGPSTSSDTSTTTTASSTLTGPTSTTAPGSESDTTAGNPCGDGLCGLDEDADGCCEDCGICSEAATVRMETGSAGGAPGTGVTPGGIADMHAYFSGSAVEHFEYAMTIAEPPVDDSSWFWAQQFFFENTTQGGYTGLQANGIIEGQTVGKMVIFSIWESTMATPGPGATCEMFGGEGVGMSCRLPFEWRANVTYRLVLEQTDPSWWTLTLLDPTTGEPHEVGAIRTPDGWGAINPVTAGFAEYYGQVDACDSMPHAVALIHTPLAGGQEPTSMNAATYGTCEPYGTSVCTGTICT